VASYEDFERNEWAARRSTAPLVLDGREGPDGADEVGRSELLEVFFPLAELISTRAEDGRAGDAPFIVSVVGSVAVGKSTTARAMRTVLALVPPGHRVDVVSTDGFLLSNRELAVRGLTERKGFPESYDLSALARFLDDVECGQPEVHAPQYSHVVYDVIEDTQLVRRPDVLILEGMPLANDRVGLSVYVDAAEPDIEQWFVTRFVSLCREAVDDDASFFRHFAGYTEQQSSAFARDVWVAINLVNLREHILPARDGSDVIMEKGADHRVRRVRLRTP
jgi:type I pantothenate kinase